MSSEKNTNYDLPTFDGPQFRCRVSFVRQNPITPTCVNAKTNLHKGDLFVLYLNDEGTEKILIEVDEEKPNQSLHPEIILDETLRRTFPFTGFMNNYYNVQKVQNKNMFSLYLVELLVKEQYLSRGDMWRFTRKLMNSTVYFKKPLDIFGMRATVYGLWINRFPYRVSSGYITNDTKVVFRSSSVNCTIFLQMSREMWEFDYRGDKYYEKAVNGFFFDLFTRWKNMNCQHDVTITLFSRVFYEAKSIEDFPARLRKSIIKDHRNRFYEDFYRVIYQNERYDDWLPRIAKLRQALVQFKDEILNYHQHHLSPSEAAKMPKGSVSFAADGNFLETLNLSSSVFERQFIDRSFDRLGQMSLIITPGGGVFEVDRELMNMTKQRVLDNGIGSDLVCLGEQPLFAVPLFKFTKTNPYTADDYQIPHWMNLSYYHSSTAPSCFKRYIPRLPFDNSRILAGDLDAKIIMNSIREETFGKPRDEMMEEYDCHIFGTHQSNEKASQKNRAKNQAAHAARKRYTTTTAAAIASREPSINEEISYEPKGIWILQNRNMNVVSSHDEPRPFNANIKDDMMLSTSHVNSASVAPYKQSSTQMNQPSHISDYNALDLKRLAKSADTTGHSFNIDDRNNPKPKPLTNPFAPASILIPLAPERRRWAHTFPIGANAIPLHAHHLRKTQKFDYDQIVLDSSAYVHLVLPGTSKRCLDGSIIKRLNYHAKTNSDFSSRPKRIVSPSHLELRKDLIDKRDSSTNDNRNMIVGNNSRTMGRGSVSRSENKRTIIWGPTGVEPWSALMITSIDWKSLTIPAILPTTFDVVPPEDSIRRYYRQNSYELIHPFPSFTEYEKKRKPLSYEKSIQIDPMERRRLLFDELIDQRLSQGFQMVPVVDGYIYRMMVENIRRMGYQETTHNRLLTIGRMYHTLSLVEEDAHHPDSIVICVKQFKAEYVLQPKTIDYNYRVKCPDSINYDLASYQLKIDMLESFQWSIVDNAVFGYGLVGYEMTDTMKYWRIRVVLVPVCRDYTIKSIESGQTKCDSRQEMTCDDFFLYVEHFVRFMIMLNKLTRNRTSPNDCNHRPLDPVTGKRRSDQIRRSSKNLAPLKTFKLADIFAEKEESMNELINLMRDEHQGLSFVKDNVLPECSFVAIEALWWSIEHCEEIENETIAMNLFKFLFEKKKVRHCTESQDEFRYGFFLYFIVTEINQSSHLVSHDYAEVQFYQTENYIPSMDYLGFRQCQPMRFLPKLMNQSAMNNQKGKDCQSAKGKDPTTPTVFVPLKRTCNVDADPKGNSDRREWAVSQYNCYYNPHCLFEMEIRWLTATSCFLSELITNWSQRTGTVLATNQVAFHLVPTPCDPFAQYDPLRRPIYIEIDSNCLADELEPLSPIDRIKKLNIFQELILKRYGFILNACVHNPDENIYYVHISGGMLVYIISDIYNNSLKGLSKFTGADSISSINGESKSFGFYWCWNFCLGKKWRTSQTGEEKYQDIMLADFRAFCSNDKNRLVNFWNEAERKADELFTQTQDLSMTTTKS